MPAFSSSSAGRLATCDERLILLFDEVVKEFDCTVLEGHRNEADQNEAYRSGHSQLRWDEGNHNKTPSLAVDVAPYPIDWENIPRFIYFGGYVLGMAARMGIPLAWGGDWNSDRDLTNQTLFDYPHFELIGE